MATAKKTVKKATKTAKKVVKTTKSFIKDLYEKSLKNFPKKGTIDPVVEAIQSATAICDKGKQDVANILSATISKYVGKKTTITLPKEKADRLPKFTFFKVSNNPNYHDYPLNKVCYFVGGFNELLARHSKGYMEKRGNLTAGNDPPDMKAGRYTHPTLEEVEAWFKSLNKRGQDMLKVLVDYTK